MALVPELVRDINPADQMGSQPFELTEVNGILFFSASDMVHGRELWRSDGTEEGTQRVLDILPGIESSFPRSLTNVDGTLYFTANDGVTGTEHWKSDGTAAGTVLVKDIRVGDRGSAPLWLTCNGETLYFTADAPGLGRELWKSDGTELGTTLVADIEAGEAYSSSPKYLVVMNGNLFFPRERHRTEGNFGRAMARRKAR